MDFCWQKNVSASQSFLPRSKCLLISWLQSPSAVILEPRKIKSDTVSTVSPSISHEVMEPDAIVVLIPQAVMEWSKRPEKIWPRKESSLHTLCPFLATPLEETLSTSWHWQVSINPQQVSPLGSWLRSLWGTSKPQNRAHHLLRAGHVIHSHKHTIALVK